MRPSWPRIQPSIAPKPTLRAKSSPCSSLLLGLDQRVAGQEKVGVELAASVSRVTDFTDPAGEVEAAKEELAPLSDMLSPRHEETECLECPGLKALQSRSLDQLAPQPSEAVAGIELAEVGSCQRAQLHVGDTRCIAVTSLEPQADSRANSHCEYMKGDKVPRDRNSDQKIQSRQRIRVAHERQIDEIFDRAIAQPGPDAIVGASSIGFRRTFRQVDAQVSQRTQTHGDRLIATINSLVKIDLQAGHRDALSRRDGTSGKAAQTLFGFRDRSGRELAMRPGQLQGKAEFATLLPTILRQ